MADERLVECEWIEATGRTFVFVVPSSALFQVDGELAETLRPFTSADPTQAVQDLPAALRHELRELQLLVPDDDPPPRLRDPSPRDDTVSTLVLQLARDCDLACRYCYCPEPRAGQSRRMSPRTAERAVDFLFEHLPRSGPAGVTLFGGEPTLNPAGLGAALHRAISWRASSGRGLRCSITTNALSVDSEMIDLLAAVDARVTVSMDGGAAAHDTHRRRRDGGGSHAAALRGLGRLAERCDLGVRATICGPAPDPRAVAEQLFELGARQVGIATADLPPGHPLALDGTALELLWDGLDSLARWYRDEALAGRHLGLTNLDGLLRTIHRGANRDHPCGAGLRLLSVDADGDLYTCHRLIDVPEHRVGSLDQGFDPLRGARVEALSLPSRPGCAPCWARYLCGGGCHHAHHLAGHRADGEGASGDPLPVCPWLRRWLRTGLALYAELSLERPRFVQEFIDPMPACPVE